MALERREIEGNAGPIGLEVATPPSGVAAGQLIVLCHGLPLSRGGGRLASRLLPELAERIAGETGWTAVVPSLRGVGDTPGTFSAQGWRDDLTAVLDSALPGFSGASLAGFGFGGSLSLSVAAADERIRGVVTMATPADLTGWCGPADLFAAACASAGIVGDQPLEAPDDLLRGVLELDPLGSIAQIPPRHLMIVHGAVDTVVPATAARQLLDAAGGRAELRIIQGGGHWLRADPRMVATILGWLDRRR